MPISFLCAEEADATRKVDGHYVHGPRCVRESCTYCLSNLASPPEEEGRVVTS